MAYRMKLLELAQGGHHDLEGQYVISYDPDWHLPSGGYDGGLLVTAPEEFRAAVFDTMADALTLQRASPSCSCHGTRRDGRPNRPLTAFNVEITEA